MPPTVSTAAAWPTRSFASCTSGTSASSSMAPSWMMRNSASPEPATTDPSRAVRRLTMPATGARTSVRASRTSSSCRCATASARSASARCSAFCEDSRRATPVRAAACRCSNVSRDALPVLSRSRVRA